MQPPHELEAYIHRSGRTGRAGKSGMCITLYTNGDELQKIKGIERHIGLTVCCCLRSCLRLLCDRIPGVRGVVVAAIMTCHSRPRSPLTQQTPLAQMSRIGVPQPHDLVMSVASNTRHMLDSVDDHSVPLFMETAKSLIEEKGAIQALARALAALTGSKNTEPRSLLEYAPPPLLSLPLPHFASRLA